MPSISFQTFLVQAFKIVVNSWRFSILLLFILWDDRPISIISGSNEQLQQQLEYTLLKLDCHCWWFSKMQSGRVDTLQEQYAIELCFKLGKKCHRNVCNASHCFSTILYESKGRESVRDDERCGRSKEVNTPELIGQRVRVRATMLRF